MASLAIVGLAGVLGSLGVGQTAIARMASQRTCEGETLGALLLFRVLAAGLLIPIGLALVSGAPSEVRLACLLAMLAPAAALGTALEAALDARARPDLTSALSLLQSTVWASSCLIGTVFEEAWIFGAGFVLAAAAESSAARIVVGRSDVSLNFNGAWRAARTLVKSSLGTGIGYVGWFVSYRLPTLAAPHVAIPEQAGYYGAAIRLSDAVLLIPTVTGNVLISATARTRSSRTDELAMAMTTLTLVGVLVGAILSPIAGWLVSTLFGPEFRDAAPAAALTLWLLVPMSFDTACGALLIGLERTAALAWTGVGALFMGAGGLAISEALSTPTAVTLAVVVLVSVSSRAVALIVVIARRRQDVDLGRWYVPGFAAIAGAALSAIALSGQSGLLVALVSPSTALAAALVVAGQRYWQWLASKLKETWRGR